MRRVITPDPGCRPVMCFWRPHGLPRRRTILLVEDEVLVAREEAATLIRFGYDVIIAPLGRKAVDIALSNGDIDLILMDIDLGGKMDGTAAVRKILDVRTLPVVFVTAHPNRKW
jgi:CheY-like chemotaxis protein